MKKTFFWIFICVAVITSMVGCTVAENFGYQLSQEQEKLVTIEQEGQIIWQKSIHNDTLEESTFTGSAGPYTVQWQEGKVRMSSAGCPDLLCVHQGWSAGKYKPIICLPQKIIITVEELKPQSREEEIRLDAILK